MAATRDTNQTNKPKGPVAAQIPPENIPISSGGPWRRFFEGLWRRVGGFQDDVYNGFANSAGLLARIYQLEQSVTDANFEAAAARQLVSSILADRREIEELRTQVAAAQQQAGTLKQQLVQLEEQRDQDQRQASFAAQAQIQQTATTKYELDHKVASIVEGDSGLTTDQVPEGATNKYFASSLARAAVSVASVNEVVSYNSGTGVFSTRTATGWTASTGTASRGAYAAYTAPTMGVAYSQTDAQADADALQALSRRFVALEADLTSRKIIGV